MNPIDLFHLQNPWRRRPDFKVEPYFTRNVFSQIEAWLDEPEIILLIGPRQSGKTTLMMRLVEKLLAQRKSAEDILYFSCDDLQMQALFDNVTDFVRFTRQISQAKKPVVFIDEIQRISEPGLFLKQLFDLKLGYKIIVSGSSALEIRSKIAEPLTGRKIVFTVLPMRFTEFLQTDDSFSPLLKTDPGEIGEQYKAYEQLWGAKLQQAWENFMVFGGYPRILQQTMIEKKGHLLREIYTSYIQKDVTDFLKIENVTGFNKLVQMLAFNSGQIINKSNLALNAGITHNTQEKYLQILKDTFVVNKVPPFFSNKAKEIVKNPKIYFIDQGIRNYATNNLNAFNARADHGNLQENFLYNELKVILPAPFSLKYWRTKVGAEVNFVIDVQDDPIPIECKSLMQKPTISRGYRNYLKHYRPSRGIVVNLNIFEVRNFENVPIRFIPYRWFVWLGKSAIGKPVIQNGQQTN